jgi:hypothetical protein
MNIMLPSPLVFPSPVNIPCLPSPGVVKESIYNLGATVRHANFHTCHKEKDVPLCAFGNAYYSCSSVRVLYHKFHTVMIYLWCVCVEVDSKVN